MDQALADFLRHLGLEKNASAHTVKSYREDLTPAVAFFRELDDVDLGDGVATVRGKGKRERLALIGDAAKEAISNWLEARTALLEGIGRRSQAVFLNRNATRLSTRSVGRLLVKYLKQTGLDPRT